jgi:outer membrane protein assembly factor BamB
LGNAYSGISIAGGRLVTMAADGGSDHVVALDAGNGKEIWRRSIAPMFPPQGGSEGGGLSVPVIDGDRVYALGAGGNLVALRLDDGDPVWSVRIDEEFGARPAHFGFATTPLIVGDLLFVQAAGTEGRSLVGLDKSTGAVLWATGDDAVGYQSPIATRLAGRRQIVAVTDKLVTGLDPDSGEQLWSHSHGVDERSGFSTAVPIGEDRFLLVGRVDTAAFRVGTKETDWHVEEIWRTADLKGSFSTPVFFEGHVYGFNAGFLTCISAVDGVRVWRSRPPGGQGLILVDGHLVILGAEGRLVVAPASPAGFEELTGVQATGSSPTYPSFAGGMFYVRDTREIAAVRVVKGKGAGAPR